MYPSCHQIGHGDVHAAKVARRDPKNRDRLAVQRNRAPNHAAVAAILALPEIAAQHREWTGAGRRAFRSAPGAAELGGRAKLQINPKPQIPNSESSVLAEI